MTPSDDDILATLEAERDAWKVEALHHNARVTELEQRLGETAKAAIESMRQVRELERERDGLRGALKELWNIRDAAQDVGLWAGQYVPDDGSLVSLHGAIDDVLNAATDMKEP